MSEKCLRNTFIFLLSHISSFFKDVPQSLSLDRFLFCWCDESKGLVRCLQDFANDPRIADVFAMFAKMFAWFRSLILRSWVADFYVDILIIQLRECLRKCSIISQMCKMFANLKKCAKMFAKIFFFVWGGKNNFYLVG